jgi:arylsulfatase A-like enzyme
LIRLPAGASAATVSHVVETVDLMPTLLDLAGMPPPPGVQGESLLPLMHGRRNPPYLAFGESSLFGGQSFVAMDDYRLHLHEGGEVELFDFRRDSLEQTDLAHRHARRVEVLKRRYRDWKEMVASASLGREAAPANDETLEQLRSLGYLQ